MGDLRLLEPVSFCAFPQKEIQGKMLKLPQKPAFLGHLSEQINDQLRESYYDPNVQINSQLYTCTI